MNSRAERDFGNGVSIGEIPDGAMIQGKLGGEDVIVARRGDEFFSVGAHCPHYGGPLARGLVVGDELRCPLHHACFSLRTGEVLRAPAFDSIPCRRVEQIGGKVFVREKLPVPIRKPASASAQKAARPAVIVGGGGAGLAAADTLRREGYEGPVTILSADDFSPYDRPNLSKEYLAGKAPEEWMPLRSADYYAERQIDLVLKSRVSSINVSQKRLQGEGGKTYEFGALLLATGADPVKIPIPGASDSQVYYLRTFADSKVLVEKATPAKHVVVVGASFIGLEVAASLRERGIGVHVVARERQPLERVFGSEDPLERLLFRRYDVHANAAFPQRGSDFESDEACANDYDMLCCSSFLDKHFGVRERAQVVNLRVGRAGDRYLDRVGPRRQQKRAKFVCLAAFDLQSLLTDVDRGHPRFEDKINLP